MYLPLFYRGNTAILALKNTESVSTRTTFRGFAVFLAQLYRVNTAYLPKIDFGGIHSVFLPLFYRVYTRYKHGIRILAFPIPCFYRGFHVFISGINTESDFRYFPFRAFTVVLTCK